MTLDAEMIERGLQKTGKSKGGLAKAMGVRAGAVSEILGGQRLIKASEVAVIMEYLELNYVPIMGRIGAGAVLVEGDLELANSATQSCRGPSAHAGRGRRGRAKKEPGREHRARSFFGLRPGWRKAGHCNRSRKCQGHRAARAGHYLLQRKRPKPATAPDNMALK
jgi:hypothetical protein